MKLICNKVDITNYVSTMTWSGSAAQVARMLEFIIINTGIDKHIKSVDIKLGATVQLYDNTNKLLFHGIVYTRERSGQSETLSYSAYDLLNYLLRSNASYNFKNTTPEQITKKLCNEFKIQVGTIASTNIPIKKMIIDSQSIYSIIMSAYTKAHKVNKKKYMLKMAGSKLCVVEKGTFIENFVLQEDTNIQNSSYSENIESMINKIKIYNEKGKQIGEVKNEDWLKKYGTFQDVYVKEKGVDEKKAANNLLLGIEKSASIEAIGNVNCMSGYAVKIKDTLSGLSGKFWIESDSHTFENGIHSMSLELVFKNLMETMDIEEEEESSKKTKSKIAKKKSGKKKVSDKDEVWVTSGGTKYHSNQKCGNMKNAKSMLVVAAKKLGKEACKRCISE